VNTVHIDQKPRINTENYNNVMMECLIKRPAAVAEDAYDEVIHVKVI